MTNILVTGATGALGAAVVNTLLKSKSASHVRILVRDEAKAADFKAKGVGITTGDYADYPSLLKALVSIEILFLISGSDVNNRLGQHLNVIRAAKESGVQKILYVSLQRKDDGKSGS